MDADIDYHAGRARRELDLGLSAESLAVARAHLQLASLHWAKLRALHTSSGPVRFALGT